MYGAKPGSGSLANNCLLARRLVESGVRYVQLFDWGWDCHGTDPSDDLMTQLPKKCREMDQPVAALLKDLNNAECSTTRWLSGAENSAARR